MKMPGYELDIPSDPQELIQRLSQLFPESGENIRQFIYDR